MGFQGSLDSVSFSDILTTLCKMKKEGTLVVSNNKNQKIVHFLDNGVTLIGDNQISLLGERLVQDGKLKEWQLDNALNEKAQTGKDLEIILLEQGLITEEEIEQIIYEHMEEEICDIFFWENAHFSFTEGPPNHYVNENKITFIFDVQSLLFRIAEQLEEWKQIRSKIPSLDIVFIVKENIEWQNEEGLENDFQQIHDLLDGTHDVRDIVKITNLSVIAVCRLFSLMLLQNLIQPAEYEDFIDRSEVAKDRGKIQLQIKLLEKALALNPNDTSIMLDIAKAYESISNGSEASNWYLKVSHLQEDIDDSIRYVETAIRYDHNAIFPKEELIKLLKNKQNDDKLINATISLAKTYCHHGELGKAISICEELSETCGDILLYDYMTNLYIDSQDGENAFRCYNILTKKANSLYPELLNKISCIPIEDKVVEKKIDTIRKTLSWEKKRSSVYVFSGAIVGILALIIYGWHYQVSAQSLVNAAKIFLSQQDFVKAQELCNEVINNYSWSSAVDEAKQHIAQVNQHFANIKLREKEVEKKQLEKIIEEIDSAKAYVKIGLFAEAKIQLQKYKEEYNSSRWINLRAKINQHIEICENFVIDAEKTALKEELITLRLDAVTREKEGEIDEAIAIWQKLEKHIEYTKESHQAIQRMQKNEIATRRENIKKHFSKAEEHEKKAEFKNAYESYSFVEKLIQKMKAKNLPEEDVFYVTDILQLVENGKKRIEELERKVKLQWNEILQFRRTHNYEKSYEKTMQILNDSRLSKTAFAQSIKPAVYISSSPQGAKVEGTTHFTPCFLEINEKNKKIVLLKNSFDRLEATVNINQASFFYKLPKKEVWQKNIDARIATSPVAIGNSLLVANSRGSIIALNKNSGNLMWEFKTKIGFGDILGGMTSFDQNIYFGSNDYFIYSIDAKKGNLSWKFSSSYFVQCTPAVDEKSVFFGNGKGEIYSLNRNTGQKIWQNKLSGAILARPIIWRREVIFASPNSLVGVDIFTGKVQWSKEISGRVILDPISREEKVYFITDNGRIYCFDIEKQEKLWDKPLKERINSPAIVWGKNMYVHDDKGNLYNIDTEKGTINWQKNIGIQLRSPIAISNDKDYLYITNDKGEIALMDFDGNIVWKNKLIDKSTDMYLVVDKAVLYFFAQTGQVHSFED